MQKLAGLITESQYIKLLEDMSVVDRILDKISDQGKDSLTPEEKEYLDKYSKGEKNIPEPSSGPPEVYASNTELYKIVNFPSIPNASNIDLPCGGDDDENCDMNDPNIQKLKELLSNKKIKDIFYKIQDDAFNQNEDWDTTLGLKFHGIEWDGNFNSPNKDTYAYMSGDGYLYINDALDKFDDKYQTEEGWGVKSWKKL